MNEENSYTRKFSLVQRFFKLLVSPSEAMRDIAIEPDYGGVVAIIIIEVILVILTVTLAFQKIQFVGGHASAIISFVISALAIASVLGIGVIVAKWLIKSLIIKYVCDSASEWDFKTAASITGYAYLPEIIMSLIGICVSWFLIPSMTIDTTNLQAAIETMNSYRAQIDWNALVYTLPFSFIALLWKSYLGGLGAHFGTEENCSLGTGIAVFFALGLFSLLLSLVIL